MIDRKSLFVRIAALSIMTVTASALLFAAEGDVDQLAVTTANEKQQAASGVEVFELNSTVVIASAAGPVASAADQTVVEMEQPVMAVALLQEPELTAVETVDMPTAAGDKATRIAKTTTIRSGPGSLYDVLGWAGTGAGIETLEQQGQWLKVRMTDSGRVCWIEADALQAVAVSQSVEVSTKTEPVVVETTPVDTQAVEKQVTVSNAVEAEPDVVAKAEESAPELAAQETASLPQADVVVVKPEPVAADTTAVESSVAETGTDEAVALPAVDTQSNDGAVTVFNTGGASAVETTQAEAPALKAETQLAEPVAPAADELAPIAQAEVTPPEVAAQMTEPALQAAEAAPQSDAPVAGEKSIAAESQLNKSESEALATAPIEDSASEPMPVVISTGEQAPAALQEQNVVVPGSESSATNSLLFSNNANLRAGPDVKFDVVTWATAGAYANELKTSGDWIQVQLQESKRMGWVHRSAIKPVDAVAPTATSVVEAQPAATTVPVAAAQEEVPVPQQSAAGIGEKQLLQTTTMRSAPGAMSEMLGWAGSGAMVAVLAQQDSWLKVRMLDSGRVGWIDSAAFEPVAPVSQEAAEPAAAVQPETLQSKETQTAQPMIAISADGQSAQSAETQTSEVADKTLPQTDLISFSAKANLRAGPDAKFDIVSWAGIGAFANQLDSRGEWIKVQMQQSKRIGWVHRSATKLVAKAAPSTVDSPAVVQEVAQVERQAGKLYFFKQTTNLRAAPGKQYDVVAWGARNETASEVERKGEWSLVRMTLSGRVGWVFNNDLVEAETTSIEVLARAKAEESKNAPANLNGAKSGDVFEVLKTSTLRVDASDEAEINSWVAKGDNVALLQRRDGWARINPQVDGKNVGWIKIDLLKEIEPVQHAATGLHIIDKHNIEQYRSRISHGQPFNFSYAALEQALYKVPVEELYINMDDDYLDAVFKKGLYDHSEFDIQMRTKGHTVEKTLLGTITVLGSSTRVFDKKSLLIKLDKEGSRWYGHRRIALRSMASDKVMMREWMAWKLMAAMGMKVPEVHLVRATFNEGKRVGLFLSVEWMGTEFLAANNMDLRGEFYQPVDASFCGDLNSSDRMEFCFDKITPQDKNYDSLRAMARVVSQARVDEMHTVLAKEFDDESVINWVAVNGLVSDGDTYNKNYWLHRDPTLNKWTVIPWDYNLTFGRTYDPFTEKPYKIWNDNFQYYYPPDVGVSNPLKDKTLHNPRLRYRLEQKIKHLLGIEANGPEDTFGWFSPTVMHARIGNLASVVGKELYKDNFITYGEKEFTKVYESLMYFVTAHDNFLARKLFGSYRWTPVDPKAPAIFDWPLPAELYGHGFIKQGHDSIYMTDEGWGLFAGQLVLKHPVASTTEVKLDIEGGKVPKYLPSGYSAMRCIQRSWVLSVEPNVSTTADLMVEYLQENSRRTEVSVSVHEDKLELWMYDGNRWKPVKTEVNEYANTLKATNVPITSGRKQRFVACSPF
ncbi:MAG: hypothetical protein AUJ57_11715 [Zetaproteobacteria bacterium CG1_02_53_45]|nr:MAG: hypothetical protein AUJ57_11715 [Zetaproteobacteria bacterium CG1_02_53_45]